jgi:glycosyltransferase involved in cell wall biosynthesis
MKISYLAIIDITAEAAQTRHVFEVCENWCRLGQEVTLFVPHVAGKPSQRLSTKVVKVGTFGLKRSFLLNLFYNWFCIFYLLKQLYLNGIDVVYTRHSSLDFISMLFLKIFGIKYVSEINGLDSEQKRLYGVASWKVQVSEWLNGICYALANSLIAVTVEIQDFIRRRYPGVSSKVHVVSNGANTEISRPMSKDYSCGQLGLNRENTYLIFVGSLMKWHGLENATEALGMLKGRFEGLKLIIVGEGPEKPHIQDIAERKGLEKDIIFAGKVRYDEVPLYVGASSVCLAPFNRERNDVTGLSPLKIFEYMACGKPVVTTRVGGLDRLIEKHDCGVAVRAEDIEALVKAISELLLDPSLAEYYGKNGREAVVKYYSWGRISERILEIVCGVYKKKSCRVL